MREQCGSEQRRQERPQGDVLTRGNVASAPPSDWKHR